MRSKLSGIISVALDATGRLLIIYSAFAKYLRKNENTMNQFISSLKNSRKCTIQLGGRSYIRFSLSLVSLGNFIQYCAGDKIEKNEMGWACGAYRWGEGCGNRLLVGKPEGRNQWGDLGVDERILERISKRWDVCIWSGVGWPRIETGGGRLWVR